MSEIKRIPPKQVSVKIPADVKLNGIYLVQRLTTPSPSKGPLGALANAFSFGGGLVNGGLSKEAMALLQPIFGFDYMGSSEFEHGAVPKTLGKLAECAAKNELVIAKFNVEAGYDGWRRDDPAPGQIVSAPVWLFCPKAALDTYRWAIKAMAADEFSKHLNLKDASRMCGSVRSTVAPPGDKPWRDNVRGWLDVSGGWMNESPRHSYAFWTISLDMAVGFAKVMSLQTEVPE